MSCLFQSLGRLSDRDPAELRQAICDYLERDPDMMGDGIKAKHVVEWESAVDLGSYVSRMRGQSTWGGATEIKAFADMTGLEVVVHDLGSRKQIRFVPSTNTREAAELHISYNGYHYEPMGVRPVTRSRSRET